MRLSSARLAATTIRLSDLEFPATRVHVPRTRVLFIHLDNLLHFAKVDRDGRIDGYVAAFLPDEVILLLLRAGELTTAVAVTSVGRTVLPIPSALADIRGEAERGELVFCDAPFEQLAWMFQSCAAPAVSRTVDSDGPETLFADLKGEQFSGVLELISDGRVNYLRFEGGNFATGFFSGKPEEMKVAEYVKRLLSPRVDGSMPDLAAAVFPQANDIPVQAAPELVQHYRDLYWGIVRVADREAQGEGRKHADRIRDLIVKIHAPLGMLGTPPDLEAAPIVATQEELNAALTEWARQLLEHLEIVAPGSAPLVLRDATREHRFLLQKAGFYDRLPWTVAW